MYLEASVKHLIRLHSDHCPLLIDLNSRSSLHLSHPFWFQPGWLSHPKFHKLVQKAWRYSIPLESAIKSFVDATKI